MSSRAAKGTQDRREHEGEQGAALQRMGDKIQNEPTDPPAPGVAPSLATGLADPEEENAKRSQNRFERFSPPNRSSSLCFPLPLRGSSIPADAARCSAQGGNAKRTQLPKRQM
jgi:hypothetical protein